MDATGGRSVVQPPWVGDNCGGITAVSPSAELPVATCWIETGWLASAATDTPRPRPRTATKRLAIKRAATGWNTDASGIRTATRPRKAATNSATIETTPAAQAAQAIQASTLTNVRSRTVQWAKPAPKPEAFGISRGSG